MSDTTNAQPLPTQEEIRKRFVKDIATRLIVSIAITVAAHAISTVINKQLDEHLFNEDQPSE